MRRAFRTTFFLAMACACAGRAWAQDDIDDARKNARFDLNGIYVTPTLKVKELGLDTNVFNLNGQQTPDFTATLSPGTDYAIPFAHRALIEGHTDVDFVYYAVYASQRSINPNVSLRAKSFFHRLTLFADGSYLNSRTRVNQEIDARARRTDKGFGAGVDVKIVPKLSVSLSGHSGQVDYADDQFFRDVNLEQSLAENLKVLTLAINYRATPLTTFVLRSEAQEDRFLYSPIKNSDSYRIMPGVEFKPRALISGSAYVGFRQFNSLNATVPNFSGLVADLSLRYTLQSATSFTVTFDRDVQYSYQEVEPYYVSTGVGISIRRQLVGSFDTTVGAQRVNNAYKDFVGSTFPFPRVDVTDNYSVDIGYRLSRKGRVAIGVSYWERESNRVADADYAGFRFGSTVNYGF